MLSRLFDNHQKTDMITGIIQGMTQPQQEIAIEELIAKFLAGSHLHRNPHKRKRKIENLVIPKAHQEPTKECPNEI